MKSVEDISLVVCSKGKYLDGSDTWSEYEKAWHYSTSVAFDQTIERETYSGFVVMVLPSGRKITVSRKDFEASL